MAEVAKQFVQKRELVSEPCPILGSNQNEQLFELFSKWAGVTHPSEDYVV